jgi:colanic acid/amylovoran biosynthesis glycosyltransferase
MTVAFVLTDPFPVPSETFILSQITGLLERGHDVRVFAKAPADTRAHADVERFRLGERTMHWPAVPASHAARAIGGIGLLARHPALVAALNGPRYGRVATSLHLLYWASALAPRTRCDVIVSHFGWNGRYAAMLREIGVLEGKLVTFFHGADMSWQLDREPDSYGPLFRSGDLFLPISEHWRAKLIAMGCPPERTDVHRMGVDCDRFALRERRLEPGSPARLIGISRLVEKKGVEYGVRAVARLAAAGRDVRYEVIGDGPMRGALERLIRELGLEDRVELRGWQDQDAVREAIARAHIALAPSVTGADGDQEGIPVALMEAMAAGLPVVSTLHSGIPELIEDGVSGRLVPERDAGALADALAGMLDRPEDWPAMGRAGRARIERDFNIRNLNDRLAERFEELVRHA